MKRILSILAVLAVAVNMVGCTPSDTAAPVEADEQVTEETAATVTTPFGYEEAIVVDDETMDFWRSLLCIKGDPITFPCTYNDLKNTLDKHGITIKPTECWSDDNPDDRDVCFVDLYDGETYFMALTGTCVSEDNLESYVFDGTLVGTPAQNYISINEHNPMYINEICKEKISEYNLIPEGDGIDLIQLRFKSNSYFCSLGFDVEVKTNILKSFSISIDNIGGNSNE